MYKNILPIEFISRLKLLIPHDKLKSVIDSYGLIKPTTFRVNTIESSTDEIENKLHNYHIPYTKVPWYDLAFATGDISANQLLKFPIFTQGKSYIQSLSSMLPVIILNPLAGNKILDLCAAPGSKTTQMAAMMHNQGEIIANEISRLRTLRLSSNLNLQGITIAQVTNLSGEDLINNYKKYFDKTLVDVPCSLEGTLMTGDKNWSNWSLKQIRDYMLKQRALLSTAIAATKSGGLIVYSTCTLAPEENEGTIDWSLNKFKGQIRLESISLTNYIFNNGLTQWGGTKFNPEVMKTVRVLPSEIMEGFYIAKIRKL